MIHECELGKTTNDELQLTQDNLGSRVSSQLTMSGLTQLMHTGELSIFILPHYLCQI